MNKQTTKEFGKGKFKIRMIKYNMDRSNRELASKKESSIECRNCMYEEQLLFRGPRKSKEEPFSSIPGCDPDPFRGDMAIANWRMERSLK